MLFRMKNDIIEYPMKKFIRFRIKHMMPGFPVIDGCHCYTTLSNLDRCCNGAALRALSSQEARCYLFVFVCGVFVALAHRVLWCPQAGHQQFQQNCRPPGGLQGYLAKPSVYKQPGNQLDHICNAYFHGLLDYGLVEKEN